MASRTSADKIRQQLQGKLGAASPKALSPRLGKVARDLAVSAEDALYVLAHENGVNISKIDPAALERVRGHLARRQAGRNATAFPTVRAGKGRPQQRPSPRVVSIKIGNVTADAVPCMNAKLATEAKKVAQEAYVRLFLIENSARELIERVMTTGYGDGWWTETIEPKIQNKAARYAANEGQQAWHPPRGADPIQFVDLADLTDIVDANWELFQSIFPDKGWFGGFIKELNVTRRVVAHMNALSDDAHAYVDAAFRKWTQLLKAKQAEIPAVGPAA